MSYITEPIKYTQIGDLALSDEITSPKSQKDLNYAVCEMDYVFPYVVTGGWSIVDIETKNENVPSYRVAININKNYVEGFQVQVWCNGKHATVEHASPNDLPASPVELFTVTDELAIFYCGTDASYVTGMPSVPVLGFQISRTGSTGTLDNDCWIFALAAGIPEYPTDPWSLGYHVKNNRTGQWLQLRRCPDGALLALDAQKSEWADVATTCQYLNGYKVSGFFPTSTINETPSLLSSLLPNTTILPDSISAAGFGMTTDGTKELSNVPTITTQNSKIQFKNATGITSEAAISTSNLYPDGSDVVTLNTKATDSKYGVVKLGTSEVIGNNKFAKVGATSGGQLAVSCATAASYGTVRLCTSTQQKVGIVGWSAFTSNGELVILQPTNTGVAHPGVMSPSHWSKPTGSIALSTFFSGDTASLSAFAPSATTEAFGMMKAAKKTEEESDPTDALTLSCISSYNILQRVKDADGSYSATNLGNERDSSYTPGIYSTTEGINSIANSFGTTEDNAVGAHAEGFQTFATAQLAHSEGQETSAMADCSHAEGYETQTLNACSHSEGFQTSAVGVCSHAEGYQSVANGLGSRVEGILNTSNGFYSHAEGYYTLAAGGSSHCEGRSTSALNDYAHSEGFGSQAGGSSSHSEGYYTTSTGFGSHSEGYETQALGQSSHSEGFQTIVSTTGVFSHAEGCETSAFGYGSHADGVKARSDDKHSYTWNGDSANEYGSHGEGTFNINAPSGLDGIYIGDKTLKQLIVDLINNPPTSESTTEETTPEETTSTTPESETTSGDSTTSE